MAATAFNNNTELHVNIEAKELWTEQNFDVLEEYYTDDFVHHSPNSQDLDLAAYEAYTREFLQAFPDSRVEVHETVLEGDMTAVTYTYRATWEGEFRGMEPNGSKVSVDGISLARIEDGKIAELWRNVDTMGMMVQMGVIDPPA